MKNKTNLINNEFEKAIKKINNGSVKGIVDEEIVRDLRRKVIKILRNNQLPKELKNKARNAKKRMMKALNKFNKEVN